MSLSRRHFLTQLTAAAAIGRLGGVPSPGLRSRPRPTPPQLAWQRDEFAVFVHFGVNTFTDREWGDGTESSSIFNPTRLDARQWVRAAKAAGAKSMVLTAKHHDGFCLWPTATTTHSVASSPWRSGSGDVVREFVDACRIEGVKPGLYCSPWDRNHPTYGDSARYNNVYMAQLTELLTRYGALHEVWFDGANGEGPNGKRQTYDWPRTWALVRKLQPGAIMFSDAGPDVRWIGNERGVAGETHWSTIRPESVPYIGASGDDVIASLQHGHPDGSVWRPSETDVSIRPGWFYHPAEDATVKSVEDLVQLYFTSVGRNSKLLLNVPPTRDGLLHELDVARLAAMRASLTSLFAQPLAVRHSAWRTDGARAGVRTIQLRAPQSVSLLDLREPISQGQRVSSWSVSSTGSRPELLASGTTIGHRQLRRIPRITVSSLTLRVETVDIVQPVEVNLFA
ncbi:alpha-L-fucosidase [Gemmatimonas sp.]|uniref:alpha-L-fucosidase n=1 Tax=Gemmatimonas sp. TaxID=1962908 RepID=UPI00286B650E|nr:alpha-L-fucosidase [Gemmatimonas sp.]